jgi:hypothetical protein
MIRVKMPDWKEKYPGVEQLTFAVMGCIVNGPGESKHADIGISLPGTGEQPAAPVFIDGQKAMTLRGPNLADDFKGLVEDYIEKAVRGWRLAATKTRTPKASRDLGDPMARDPGSSPGLGDRASRAAMTAN